MHYISNSDVCLCCCFRISPDGPVELASTDPPPGIIVGIVIGSLAAAIVIGTLVYIIQRYYFLQSRTRPNQNTGMTTISTHPPEGQESARNSRGHHRHSNSQGNARHGHANRTNLANARHGNDTRWLRSQENSRDQTGNDHRSHPISNWNNKRHRQRSNRVEEDRCDLVEDSDDAAGKLVSDRSREKREIRTDEGQEVGESPHDIQADMNETDYFTQHDVVHPSDVVVRELESQSDHVHPVS